jgi:hypothetical protein
MLTWDDSAGASGRGRPGRPGARPDRVVTFRSGIAFPSAHDHGALCPRQARSAQPGRTLSWLKHRKRTTIRNSTPRPTGRRSWAGTRSPAAPACPAPIRLACPGSRPAGKNGRARCHMPVPPRSQTGGGSSGAGQASPAGTPEPGPTGLGPQGASATSRGWRRPCSAGGSGGAPPRASTGPGPASIPAFRLPAAAPGGSTHLSPPALRPIGEQMEFMWRIPRHRGVTFRRAGPNDHRGYRGRRCRRPGASGRRGRRSQADAARTRPPSPPKLVRAAQPLPCTPRHLHLSRIFAMITPVSSRFR